VVELPASVVSSFIPDPGVAPDAVVDESPSKSCV